MYQLKARRARVVCRRKMGVKEHARLGQGTLARFSRLYLVWAGRNPHSHGGYAGCCHIHAVRDEFVCEININSPGRTGKLLLYPRFNLTSEGEIQNLNLSLLRESEV